MKKEDLIKQLSSLAPETQEMLLDMLIDIRHSKEGPTGNSRIVDLAPNQELNLFGGNNHNACEYMEYIKDNNCDQLILSAVLKYHLVKMGADSVLPGKETIDAVCKYGYELTVPQIHAVILGMNPEEAKKNISGSIFDKPQVDSNTLEMNKQDIKPLVTEKQGSDINDPLITNIPLEKAIAEPSK